MMAVHSSDATDSRLFPTPSLLRRLSCWFYEGVLLFGVVFIAGYLFSSLTQTRHALDNRHGLQAFVCLVLALYFTSLFLAPLTQGSISGGDIVSFYLGHFFTILGSLLLSGILLGTFSGIIAIRRYLKV